MLKSKEAPGFISSAAKQKELTYYVCPKKHSYNSTSAKQMKQRLIDYFIYKFPLPRNFFTAELILAIGAD